jgi:hypothetical protein
MDRGKWRNGWPTGRLFAQADGCGTIFHFTDGQYAVGAAEYEIQLDTLEDAASVPKVTACAYLST